MGSPIPTARTSGISRQGPVQLRRRRASLEATAAAIALLAAVLLALVLQPDLTAVATGMVLLGALALIVVPPARVLLGSRAGATTRRR